MIKRRRKKKKNWAWICYASIILALAGLDIIMIIAGTFGLAYRVEGSSMEPNLHNGDVYLASKIKSSEDIKRGDIICTYVPGTKDRIVKRIVGLPGEYVKLNSHQKIEINGIELEEPYLDESRLAYDNFDYKGDERRLKDDEVFIMGDNRSNSFDARYFGPIKIKDLQRRFNKKLFNISFKKLTR